MKVRIKRNEIFTAGKVYHPRRIYNVSDALAHVWIKMGWASKVKDVIESS